MSELETILTRTTNRDASQHHCKNSLPRLQKVRDTSEAEIAARAYSVTVTILEMRRYSRPRIPTLESLLRLSHT